ncbi:MAG: hypothetical protein HRT50_16910 [Colwellia sp.]|uniref:hypothetical protein n=1 Tax=Colwellia sp. TaxID=56799 RepID=UPI001E1369E0|nr:hypothetical protein [Colwellia sp.]NQY50743.1 hypothetical protein [Colwellia sp.]
MNINQCSKQLRELTKAHAHYQLSLADYRRERKVLLDALDLNVNGIAASQVTAAPLSVQTPDIGDVQQIDNNQQLDKTQPYFAKKLDTCMNFIKGSNNS